MSSKVVQRTMVKILIFTLMLTTIWGGMLPKAVRAAEGALAFGTVTSGELKESSTENQYEMVVTESGRVTFEVTSFIQGSTYLKLVGDNQENLLEKTIVGSNGQPGNVNTYVDLEPGKYTVVVNNGNVVGNYGTYTLKPTFEALGNQDMEPNNTMESAQSIPLDETVLGYITATDRVDYYRVVVKEYGYLDVALLSGVVGTVKMTLMDRNEKVIQEDFVTAGESYTSDTYLFGDVPPGTYYIKITNGNVLSRTGPYLIVSSFESANVNEVESNNGMDLAQSIGFGKKMKAIFTYNDYKDYYKIVMPRPGNVTLSVTSHAEFLGSTNRMDIDVKIVNTRTNFNTYNLARATEGIDGKVNRTVYLPAGTYYISFERMQRDIYDYTASYQFQIDAPSLKPSYTVYTLGDNMTTIKGKTQSNVTLAAKINGKYYKTTSKSDGTFSITIPKQKAGTKVLMSATNVYGTTYKTITVVDKTAPVKPTIVKLTTKSTKITGKTEANATVVIKVGTKTYKTKANAKGTYSYTIKRQKRNIKVAVYAMDKAGNRSGTASVYVR